MLMPLEKIAIDAMDERALRQIGRAGRAFGNLVRGGRMLKNLARPMLFAGRMAGKGIQAYGDALVKSPTRTLSWSAPLAAGMAALPKSMDMAMNNVHPENPYKY